MDPNPSVSVMVRSNQPVDGTGDGSTSSDWVIVDYHHFMLRAERSGAGEDRVYTIRYTVTDAAGNQAIATRTVTVPHDRKE